MFKDTADTEIPKLQEFLQKLGQEPRRRRAEQLLPSLHQLLSDIKGHLSDSGTKVRAVLIILHWNTSTQRSYVTIWWPACFVGPPYCETGIKGLDLRKHEISLLLFAGKDKYSLMTCSITIRTFPKCILNVEIHLGVGLYVRHISLRQYHNSKIS